MRTRHLGLIFVAAMVLAACQEPEVILPGTRYDIRTPLEASLPAGEPAGAAQPLALADAGIPENRALPVALGAPQTLSSWPQRGANPSHRLPHLALRGSLTQLWSASIGQGSGKRHRITADPVSDGARIYTLDSRARVSAFAPSGGQVWSTDLVPPGDGANDAAGGGLAVADGRLFVSSGFGTLTALEAASGKVLWTQRLDAVGNASPTVAGNLVYVVGRDNRAWAVRTSDGKVDWAVSGTPDGSGIIGGGGVATDGRIAVIPYSSGEILAVLAQSGVRSWSAQLEGHRRGRAYARVDDIADPVLAGGTMYAATASGRLAAFNAGNGERLWTANEGALAPVVLAGGSVFLVSDNTELVRLDATTGERIWGVPLPGFREERPRRYRNVTAHYGPLLAGGRILVASDDGVIRLFDPVSGALAGQVALPGGAASNPIVVGGTLYVVTGNGQLVAFR